MTDFKKFLLHFSQFIVGSLSTMLFGFISFPILTRVLTKGEYGVLGLVMTTISLVVAFSKAGLSEGIIRFYSEFNNTTKQINIFTSTIVIRGLFFSIVAVIIYSLFFPIVRPLLGINNQFLSCFMIMALYLFIRPLNIIVLNFLRVNGKALFFNVVNFFTKVISVSLGLLLLIYVIKDLDGYFLGFVAGEYIIAIVLFVWFFSRYKVYPSNVSRDLSKKLIIFGIPLLFSELSYLLLSYADRYMIIFFYNEKALGLYSVGYNLAMYIANIVVFSLNYAVVPIYVKVFAEQGKEKTERFLSDCFDYLMIAVVPICFGYHAISKELFVFLASDKYAQAAGFSSVILLGTIILGMNSILNAGLYIRKRTMLMLFIMLAAVIVNIILNYFLIPTYGVQGAAFATLISSIMVIVLTVFFSFRYLVVKPRMRNFFYHIGLSVCMYALISRINFDVLWLSLLSKIIAGILFIFIGVFIKEKKIRVKILKIISP